MKKVKHLLILTTLLLFIPMRLYSDADVDKDIQALCDVGILPSDAVTYMDKEIDRLTAAKSVIRLMGKYDVAVNCKGNYNFNDINIIKSQEDISILAYVKATKLFSGDSLGNFLPYGKTNSKDYYNAIFKSLGYARTSPNFEGDYDDDSVFEFAESLGFDVVENNNMTWEDAARIMVQSLKIRTKEGKRYADKLAVENKIDKEKAMEAGLYIEALPKPASVATLGNAVLEVRFGEDVKPSAVVDIRNYRIEGLTIKKVVQIDAKTIHIETTSQTKGNKYTLEVGEFKSSFTGVDRVTAVTYITSMNSPDGGTLEINFNRPMDYTSSSDVANYSIPGIEIKSVVYGVRKITLSVSGLTPNRYYNIIVNNLKSIDKVSMGYDRKVFHNKVDLSPPELKELKVETNNRIALYFNEAVDKASAENISNYSIISNGIEQKLIKAAIFGSKNDGVKLTMDPQSGSQRYELAIKNVSDRAKNKNTIKKPVTKTFHGMREDKTEPQIIRKNTEIISKEQIRVAFYDKSELDEKSILNPKNYEIVENNRDKDVVSVTNVKKESYKDGIYKAILTVDYLKPRSSYNLSVYDVMDEFGNALASNNSLSLRMKGELAISAKVKSYNMVDNSKIEIIFSKDLDKATAENADYYIISQGIGSPNSVSCYKNKATLLLAESLEERKSYNIKIEGVEDIAGNVLNISLNIKGKEEPPEVQFFSQYDDKTFEMIMSEEIKLVNSRAYMGGESFKLSVDKEDKCTVYLSSSKNIDEEKEYSLDISEYIVDLKGIKAKNKSSSKTVLQEKWGEYVDRDKPYITKVVYIDDTIIEVWYNEDLSYAGTYYIEYYDEEDNEEKTLTIKSCEIKGYQVVIRLDEETPIEEEVEYKLKIKIQAKDTSGNISENKVGDEFNIEKE